MSRKMKGYTITSSADGSAGKTSARSSVLINLDQLCIPVARQLQEYPTSGKHAGDHALSSMRCQRLKGLSETQKTSQQISPRGSQIQPKVRCVTP